MAASPSVIARPGTQSPAASHVFGPLTTQVGPENPPRTGFDSLHYRSQWGFSAFWRFLSDISATRGRIHAKFYLYRDNVCRRALSLAVGSIGPWEAGEEELKTQKMGGGLIRAADKTTCKGTL